MILSGGGGVTKNPAAYELFAENVNKNRPVLYIPFASVPENYAENYAKFALTMANLGIMSTRLCDTPDYFKNFDPESIGGIYCAGGNTFRLLKTLRECGAIDKIRDYVKGGGAYIGSSAGAIIAGADIMPIIFMDANAVLLDDTRGMDMMNGYSTIAHYNNSPSEFKNAEWRAATDKLATKYDRLIALSEESAVVITNERTYIQGADTLVFESGAARVVRGGENLF
jgi:dipeptidase E